MESVSERLRETASNYPHGMPIQALLREAAARIESLEAERDGLRRTLDSVLDTNPSGDCWCDSGHEHAGTVCMGCWARGRRPKPLPPLAEVCRDILTAGYPRSQCDPMNDPSSEVNP